MGIPPVIGSLREYFKAKEAMFYDLYDPWERLPRWHMCRWFGYDLRRWCNHPHTGGWEYGRSKEVARETLREQYETTR